MEWAAPAYLWMLLALPLVAGLFVWAQRRRRAAYAHGLVPEALRPTLRWRRGLQGAFVTAAAALIILGIARPRMSGAEREVEQRGLDLVIVLDLSRSMMAEDIAPTRLDRVRNELHGVLDQLAGDRVGLVVFAGTGLLQAPLTTDYAALRSLLDAADPATMPTPGSNLEGALQAATSALRTDSPASAPGEPPHARAALLLSDGEFHDSQIEAARAQARAHDIALYTAGVGTEAGARVPVPSNRSARTGRSARTEWLRDNSGSVVTSRLNADALRALPTGPGRYYELGAASGSLTTFVDDLRGLERSLIGVERFDSYYEGFWIPLLLALVLLVGDAVWNPARPALATNASPPSTSTDSAA